MSTWNGGRKTIRAMVLYHHCDKNAYSKAQLLGHSNSFNLRWDVGVCTLTKTIVGDSEAVVS